MKRCSKCDVPRRPEEFAKCSASADGLQAWCRFCKAKSRPEKPQRVATGDPAEKECGKCREMLPNGNFAFVVKNDPDFGRQCWCKECMRTYRMDRRARKENAAFERLQRENVKQDRYELAKFDKLTNL